MQKIFDCFLYNNEVELLEIRLRLLADVVDKFVVVCSRQTFTGITKDSFFPNESSIVRKYDEQIRLVVIDHLEGETAWEKEWYSRNKIGDGLFDAAAEDVILVSDVDEIPRPEVIQKLKASPKLDDFLVLGLDYFNFKFNFKLIVGLQAVWAGPVACARENFISAQGLRDKRWLPITDTEKLIFDGGWHFSYLAVGDNVDQKLASYSHQEREIQYRRESIDWLVERRQGFHDHLHPGSVWAIVDRKSLSCSKLDSILSEYPQFFLDQKSDDQVEVSRNVRLAINRMHLLEKQKVAKWFTAKELLQALYLRVINRITRNI